jgi:hypothetical protein
MSITVIGQELGWQDLFPSYNDPAEIDPKLLTLVQLCGDIELPFPAEPKRPYSTWWHSLHEIGHWAVKPPWYLAYSNWMRGDIVIRRGHLHIPAHTIPGVGEIDRPGYLVYGAGNDLIPDISLLRDPTPGEFETRVWSLLMIRRFGWPHPLDENKTDGMVAVTSGDQAFHKAASARVWFREQINDPTIACSLQQWGIDPASGHYRAKGHGFLLPYPRPRGVSEIVTNMDAIYRRYNPDAITPTERESWITDYLFPRFIGKFA